MKKLSFATLGDVIIWVTEGRGAYQSLKKLGG